MSTVVRAALLALLAGCRGAPTTDAAASHRPDRAPAHPAGARMGAEAPDSLTLDAEIGRTVRGRLASYDNWTFVEVCVKEIAAPPPGGSAAVRFTMRLCTEDGRTEAVAKRWSKEAGWEFLYTDSLYEAAEGGTVHQFFECPYGTGWDVDVAAEDIEGGRVRLVLRGKWQVCTK